MHAYSMDLRLRVLAATDDGDTTADVADRFAVSPAWVRRLKQRRRETGETAPRARRPARPRKLDPHADAIRAELAARPSRTLAELRDALGLRCALATLWAAVRRLGLTFKKTRPAIPTG